MLTLGVAGVRCSSCGRKHVAPQYVCRACGAEALEPVDLGATGRLLTFTTVRVPPEAMRDQAPYHVGLIELEGGLRLTARIQPLAVKALTRSRVQLVRQDDYGYVFEPISDSAQLVDISTSSPTVASPIKT